LIAAAILTTSASLATGWPKGADMDDELPLTALAKPQKKLSDDNMPLSMLSKPGGAGAPGRGRPSSGKAPLSLVARPASGAVAGQVVVKKKKGKSSSSSSTSTSSSDSSSESGGKKKPKGGKGAKLRLLNKKKVVEKGEGEEEDNVIRKKDRTPKESVVVDLLIRWWYALPDWPPAEPEYYEAELAKRKLRRVSIQEWEWVPEIDKDGRAKVYELMQFKGIFRKDNGESVDIRPMDNCPSFQNMMKRDLPELYGLLVKAYEGQLKDLTNSRYDESELTLKLNIALTRIREKARQAEQMSFMTGGAAKKQKVE